MNRLPEPEARDLFVVEPGVNKLIRRRGGWAMFAWSILVGNIVASAVLFAVSSALPTCLDPVAWTAGV